MSRESEKDIVAIVAFVLALIIAMPLAAIWSVNVLFGTVIPITFKTWFASFVLCRLVSDSYVKGRKN